MAGPLSSEEIEDVVSSVRRLVSNEQSPRQTSRDVASDRLLLTPSLRVVADPAPLVPLVLGEGATEELLPETAEAPVAFVPEPAVEAEIDLIEAEWEDEIWSGETATSLGEVALGAEEAELLSGEDEAVRAAASAAQADDWAADEPVDGPIPFIPLRRRAESLAARLAAESSRDPAAPAAAAPEEPADVRPAEADAEAPTRMPTEILDADGTSLAVLDEAALQDIVRQMIRDELQGALGERITRNVRKLVRAEINRALMARDLD